MAKLTPRSAAPTPAYSPGYTWMLLFTVIAMAGGAALHFLETDTDYNGVVEPKGLPAVPKLTPVSPPRDQSAPKGNLGMLNPLNKDDRAELPFEEESTAVEEPRHRVGPTILQLPPPLPLPGISTR